MASYKYEIVGPDGKPKSGTIEAQNIEIATAELKAGGSTIVSIARANASQCCQREAPVVQRWS